MSLGSLIVVVWKSGLNITCVFSWRAISYKYSHTAIGYPEQVNTNNSGNIESSYCKQCFNDFVPTFFQEDTKYPTHMTEMISLTRLFCYDAA